MLINSWATYTLDAAAHPLGVSDSGPVRPSLSWYRLKAIFSFEWESTPDGNVRVLKQTADFYRFFDATPHAEFLCDCFERTIDVDLPAETHFLKAYDAFRREVAHIVDMADRTADLLSASCIRTAGCCRNGAANRNSLN